VQDERGGVLLRVDEGALDGVGPTGNALVPEVDRALVDEPLGAKLVRADLIRSTG
jgi:hypothetical protein